MKKFIQKYYNKKQGLNNNKSELQEKFKFFVGLSSIDKLLGTKITDIEYNEEVDCPEIIIYLDNGRQIEFYMNKYKELNITSD